MQSCTADLVSSIAEFLGSPPHRSIVHPVLEFSYWESQLDAYQENRHLVRCNMWHTALAVSACVFIQML